MSSEANPITISDYDVAQWIEDVVLEMRIYRHESLPVAVNIVFADPGGTVKNVFGVSVRQIANDVYWGRL